MINSPRHHVVLAKSKNYNIPDAFVFNSIGDAEIARNLLLKKYEWVHVVPATFMVITKQMRIQEEKK